MKQKPVLAYILSSIAMVLVCIAYYIQYLIYAREVLDPFIKHFFKDFSIDTEYLMQWSVLSNLDIHISLVIVPIFFIVLLWAVRGRLKAKILLTGLMFYPISSFYAHSFYEQFKYDYSSDFLLLVAFSLSFFAVILSIISLQADKQGLNIQKRITKIIPISYLLLVVFVVVEYVLRGSFKIQLLDFHPVHNTDLFSLILVLTALTAYFTKTIIQNSENGYIILPILVTALTVSVISQVYVVFRPGFISYISKVHPTHTLLELLDMYYCDTIITLSFSLLSILYLLYLYTRFDEREYNE